MSSKPGKSESAGKGDARRDNLTAFSEGMKYLKRPTAQEWSPRGMVFLQKQGRTIFKYGN